MSEQEFVEQLNANEGAIHYVCNNYCYNFSRKDLMQDIALELWENISSFKNSCKFSTWIHAVARNVCIDKLRRQQTQPVFEEFNNMYAETLAEVDNRPELIKQLREAARYNSVLNTIEEPYQALFHKYVYGASFKELEQISGIAENTLRVRIHRIKKQLQLRYGNEVI